MATRALHLPAPVKRSANPTAVRNSPSTAPPAAPSNIPTYEERYSKPGKFKPRSLAAFGKGGAYPEILVSQYPLNMGNPRSARAGPSAGKPGATVASVTVDATGTADYTALVKRNNGQDKTFATIDALRGSDEKDLDLALATQEDEEEAADRTR